MKVEVIGSRCQKCESLYNKVKALKEKGVFDGDIEYIKDVNELINRGIMGSPALVVDGKVACVGMPSDEELKKALE